MNEDSQPDPFDPPKWITLTPELARHLLSTMVANNRRPSDVLVQRLARDMETGQWLPTHQPIAINERGELFDGQHRCLAVIQSGRSVRVLFCQGVPQSSFTAVDRGKVRTPGDILTIAGVTSATNMGATARVYLGYRLDLLGQAPWPARGGRQGRADTLTPAELLACIQAHPKMREALPLAQRMARGVGRDGLRTGIAAGLTIILEDAPRGWARLGEGFVLGASEGMDLAQDSPLFVWRKWAMNPQARSRVEIMAVLLKVWRAYAAGREMRQAKVTKGEPVPAVSDCA